MGEVATAGPGGRRAPHTSSKQKRGTGVSPIFLFLVVFLVGSDSQEILRLRQSPF